MKLKKVLLGCLLCLMTLFVMGGVPAEAASKKVKLVPSVTYETHNGYFVKIKIALAEGKIASVEYQKGKVKKTADKYWSGVSSKAWRDYNDDKKNTYYSFDVTENGYYSVRVTTTKGKKYTANIKISNIAPKSDDSRRMAFISKVSKPDSKGNFTVTADYYTQLTAIRSEFAGNGRGDVITIDGRKVEIIDFYKKEGYSDAVLQDSFNDETGMVVVKPVDPKDFADIKDDYCDNPFITYDDCRYGYVLLGNNVFYAYLE